MFIPTKYELREAIKRAISEGIQVVCDNERYLMSKDFSEFTSSRDFDDG